MARTLLTPRTARVAARTMIAAVALVVIAARPAVAQQYPAKPIRVLVGFGPGAPDTVARLIGPALSAQLGQPVVVENRPGANGVIATDVVAKAPADGYTLLLTSSSIAVNPSIYKKLPYELPRDLTPITSICETEAYILGINPGVPAKTLQELIAYAKKPDAKLAYGSPGVGNSLHLAAELFNARAGTKLLHVPYKGAGAAIAALLANEVQVMFLTAPLSIAHIRAGKLRAIGYTHTQRAKYLPDVPTLIEAGLDMKIDGGFYGLFAPAGLAPEIANRLHAEVVKAIANATVRERFAALGLDPVGSAPADFAKMFAEQIRINAELVKLAAIQPE